MPVRRALFPVAKSYSTKARLARVERMARANRPEMKSLEFDINGSVTSATVSNTNLVNIGLGDADGNRTGNTIKVWRIEIRGLTHKKLDHYLLLSPGKHTPLYSDFGTTYGAFVTSNSEDIIRELRHFRNFYADDVQTNSAPLKISYRFKNGLLVHFSGTSAGDAAVNKLWFSVLNQDATAFSCDVSAKVWFTDN